jgi:glycosyltransferase involved in cell wall biosynthesis
MVSSIRPVKNLRAAIRAFAELERKIPNVRLILIGPVLDQEEAERVLELGDKFNCFRYLGEKSQSVVRKFMAASDIFLNTSLNEGMPGAVLEAMAEGLPILASAITGNRSLVVEGKNGLFFPVDRREELVRAAIRLASDRSLRKRMGEASRQIAATNYSIERELDGYQRVYKYLLEVK